MNLDPYVDRLVRELLAAAELGGEAARQLAERLVAPLDAATRLAFLEALSAAAGEITLDLVPGSVEVRLRGRDPEFVVRLPPQQSQPENAPTEAGGQGKSAPADGTESGTARMTLRLTEPMKLRIEEAAGKEGLSVNAWLGRVIGSALDAKDTHSGRGPPAGRRFTGWVR